jgi:hypothetical protein
MSHQWSKEEQKVLDNFLDGERIIRLPAKQKKRLVILRWLLLHIAPDKRIPERDLNALIARHHPDFATIRRELVEFGFMLRERSVYWRTDRTPEDPQLEQD